MSKQIDLLPDEYYLRQRVTQRILLWLAVAGAVTGAVILSSINFQRQAAKMEYGSLVPLRSSVASMGYWNDLLAPLAAELETTQQRQVVVNELLKEPRWNGLFSDLAAAADDQLRITNCRIKKERLKPKTPEKNAKKKDPDQEVKFQHTLFLAGSAPSNFSIIRFMTKLSGSENLSNLVLEESTLASRAITNSRHFFEMKGTIK